MLTDPKFEALAKASAGNPVALARLALMCARSSAPDRARDLAERARALAPDSGEVAALASAAISRAVPDWHFSIVRDDVRNRAYEDALKRRVAGKKVLEVGAGSGILSMLAARAGAAQVIACEMNPAIAAAAREIVARNGFAGRVTIVAKKSFDLDADADMGGRADAMVSEIVSNNLLGESVLRVVEDAHRHLLKPGAQIIPETGSVRVALANDPGDAKHRMGEVSGFDLSTFNRLAQPCYRVKAGSRKPALLSAPGDLFHFDFRSTKPFPAAKSEVFLTSTGGTATCIAQWIALKMDADGWYENPPGREEYSCWAVLMYPLPHPREFAPGQKLRVCASHDREGFVLWTED